MNGLLRALLLAPLSLIAACSGDYSGGGEAPLGGGTTGGGSSVTDCASLFASRVQPALAFCRSCHVPGGIADVDDGRDFMLGASAAEDYASLRASWERLGRNDAAPSRILRMASGTDSVSHSGGAPWPVGSAAYVAMDRLLKGFVDPAQCAGGSGGDPVEQHALLGSKRAKHRWETYCAEQADDALLPPDPRTLVQAGINQGKAVHFNGYWENCHAAAPPAEQQAKTCGEYRARRERGRHFLMELLPASPISAEDYNNTWQKWGLPGRPDDFDALYTLRYGLNPAPFANPYPLPGEDPNATHGGSGQLPLGLRQLRDAQGRWTGQIASGACFQCHGGAIEQDGDTIIGATSMGLGNNNYDVIMATHDGAPWAQAAVVSDLLPAMDANTLFNVGIKQRGQNNAVGAFEFLNTILDLDSLGINPNPLKTIAPEGAQGVQDVSHPLAHTQDTPPWWNMGSRPRKFFDAGVSNDSTRIIMAAGPGEFALLFSQDGKPYRDRIEEFDQDLEAFFLSLESPPYPHAIDTALAEQGAILFHTKDLWAEAGNAGKPKPAGGNGSCASCHGAYSPRFVNDPRYLDDPVLEGVAAHIATLDVIGTDRARSDMLTTTLRKGWDTTYWGYPESAEGYVAPEDKDPFTEGADDMFPGRPVGACGWMKDVIGYQAPPLYGVWATAPYLHNGSVPTIAQLLDSSQRPAIWRRQLQSVGAITGFDQRLAEAYDTDALGWRHEPLNCDQIPGTPQLNCSPAGDAGPSLPQLVQNLLNGSVSWAGLLPLQDPAPGSIDKRLVYDTRTLGNGNGGHSFSDVLTAAERRAIIEYLKTL